jgi:hypothetical protein
MRFLLTLFCTLVTLTLLALDQPESTKAFAARVSQSLDSFWRGKEIWVSGTSVVARKDIDALLPNDESVLSWLLSADKIEASLRSNPLIANASVERCPGKWWGCFSISIEEREPAFLLLVGSKGWLVGGDGGILTPLPQQRCQSILRGESPPEFMGKLVPVVEGAAYEEESPDLVKARLGVAKRAIDILAQELKTAALSSSLSVLGASKEAPGAAPAVGARPFEVERLSFRQKYDMRVRFRDWPFVVTFGLPQSENWESGLRDQCARLGRLLEELGASALQAKEIDLAFDSVAVVRPSLLAKEDSLPIKAES